MVKAVPGEQLPLGLNFGPGHAALKVGTYVVRFGHRGVIGVVADVQVVVVVLKFLSSHHAGISVHIAERRIGARDLLDMLGQ